MTDILLHETGHIMLSDFDLAKQSQEPGGLPAAVMQIENGVWPFSACFVLFSRGPLLCRCRFLSSTLGLALSVFERIPLWVLKVRSTNKNTIGL
jgi:hypothetical protein